MTDKVRFAVVGIGNIGSAHAVSLYGGKIADGVLAAVCDTDPARREWAAEQFPGLPVYDDFDALLRSGVMDAVIIATPHRLHPPMAIAAMERGYHVLTEKPGGVQTSAVRRMNETAERSGQVFGVMFNQRTNPLFARMRQIVQSGEIGVPKRLQWTVTNWYRHQSYYNSGGWRATWTGEGGGVLLNQAPHQLDLWQWIFGMPQTVWAHCACGRYHDIEVEDDATIVAQYANGATATFITTTGEYPGTNRLEIVGDREKLVLEDGLLHRWRLPHPEREFCFAPGEERPQPEYTVIRQEQPETAHNGIIQNFAEAILHGMPLLAPGSDAIRELTISNAAYLSAWTGEKVSLPLDEEKFDALLAERAAGSAYHQPDGECQADGLYKPRWSVQW